jgi:twinkle protein
MKLPQGLDLDQYIELTSMMDASQIHSAGKWRDEVLERSKGQKIWGAKLPWSKTWETFRLREGELTLFAGANASRKSMICGEIILHLLKHSKVCLASLEMKPSESLYRMLMQSAGAREGTPNETFIDEFTAFTDKNLVIFDQLDTVKPDRVLAIINYCAKELGCKYIFVDSLAKCGTGFQDYSAETEFVNKLQHSAKTLGIGIILVAHIRKPPQADDNWIPDKYSIRGASTLSDMADNVILTASNPKRKQLKELTKITELDEKQQEYLAKHKDQKLIIAKQRHAGGWEGTYNFYFHDNSLQLTEQENRPRRFYFENNEETVDDDIDLF